MQQIRIKMFSVMKHVVEVVQVAVSSISHDSWMNTCELWLSIWSPSWACCRTPRKMTRSEMFIQGQETLCMADANSGACGDCVVLSAWLKWLLPGCLMSPDVESSWRWGRCFFWLLNHIGDPWFVSGHEFSDLLIADIKAPFTLRMVQVNIYTHAIYSCNCQGSLDSPVD